MVNEFPKLKSRLVLAPMHNITNSVFRLMCRKYGASLVSTELLSANAIARGGRGIDKLISFNECERPIVVQIFGQNIENIIKAGKRLEKNGFDVIDFNCGCPSGKIMKQGAGGALLKRPLKIKEIVKKLVESVRIPVSVKIRSEIEGKENAVKTAKICEEAGASAVIVHARSVEQGYSGEANWSVIKKVKERVSVPIIGNGDVCSGEDALKMIEETNCDYVMIGRGAIGNPFIFKSVREYLKSGSVIEQSSQDRVRDYFEYIDLCKKFGIYSLGDAKLKAKEFTKGLVGSSRLRRELSRVKDFDEIVRLMKNL